MISIRSNVQSMHWRLCANIVGADLVRGLDALTVAPPVRAVQC